MTLRERFQFFHEHAGYIVGRRAECAIALARAEAKAEELGLDVEWDDEDHEWDADAPAPPIHVWARVPDPENPRHSLAALGSIGLNSWRDTYVRVVKAELFAEALDMLDVRDGYEAEKLAARATYASV